MSTIKRDNFTRQSVIDHVGKKPFLVNFTKANGTVRIMKASLDFEGILKDKVKSVDSVEVNTTIMKCLTLETTPPQWRSVPYEKINQITVEY